MCKFVFRISPEIVSQYALFSTIYTYHTMHVKNGRCAVMEILWHFRETVPYALALFRSHLTSIQLINQSVIAFHNLGCQWKHGRTATHLFAMKSLVGCMHIMSFARGIKHGIKQTKLRGKWSVSYGQYRGHPPRTLQNVTKPMG